MRERPILFSGEMVRAILNGTKTQTRRVISLRHGLEFFGGRGDEDDPTQWGYFFDGPEHHGYCVIARGFNQRFNNGLVSMACPFGELGDRLWVRETWKQVASGGAPGPVRYGVAYQADGATLWQQHKTIVHFAGEQKPTGPMQFQDRPWRPSIHMPRWASRITLEINNVRVERLNDISAFDAMCEGLSRNGGPFTVIEDFAELWDGIYAKTTPWSANPWVWVVEFKRVEGGAA